MRRVFDHCVKDSQGRVLDPRMNTPILENRLIEVEEGGNKWCMDADVILEGMLLYGIRENPYTGSPLPDHVIQKVVEYRVGQLKTVQILDHRKDGIVSSSVDSIVIDGFARVGDLFIEVVRKVGSSVVEVVVKVSNVALTDIDLDQRIDSLLDVNCFAVIVTAGTLSGDQYVRLKNFLSTRKRYADISHSIDSFLRDRQSPPSRKRDNGRTIYWLPIEKERGEYVWDVVSIGEGLKPVRGYRGEPMSEREALMVINKDWDAMISSEMFGLRVKRYVANLPRGQSILPVSRLFPWKSKEYMSRWLLWYPIIVNDVGNLVWTLVDPDTKIEREVLSREDTMSQHNRDIVERYNTTRRKEVITVGNTVSFTPTVIEYMLSGKRLPDPEDSNSYAWNHQRADSKKYWYPVEETRKGYVWDVGDVSEPFMPPPGYKGEPMPVKVGKDIVKRDKSALERSPLIGTRVKNLLQGSYPEIFDRLPSAYDTFPWETGFNRPGNLLWYPLKYNGKRMWTVVARGARVEEEVLEEEMMISNEERGKIEALSADMQDSFTPRVIEYVMGHRELPDPGVESNYAWSGASVKSMTV